MPRLNAPTILIFLLSLLLAIFALTSHLIPDQVANLGLRFLPDQDFWLAVIAYVVLMIGNLVRGL